MDVQARVDGLTVEVALAQTFVNAFDEPLEATYIFPLPDRAAVTRFRMEVAGRVIEGVLQERGEARRQYEQALVAGHRAAITEEERPGVFTLRVGNLMPGEAATVRLTLAGPLPYSDGEATFRFPLVVAPRYIPGIPLPGPSVGDGTIPDTDAVPDASRITPPVLLPGYPNPVRLSLAVDVLPSNILLSDFRSTLHTVVEGEKNGGLRRLTLQPGERLNRDFILRFRVGEKAVETSLSLKPDANGSEGTFLLTIVPPASAAAASKPRDVIFVLDRSGSMEGWKMVAARRALGRMVDTLTDRDRFTVYAFDNTIETPPAFRGHGLETASDRNRFRAIEFLAGIEARGGTEMAQPLDLAVRQLNGAGTERERILVLVTDGQVGNEDQILRGLGARLANIRIFTLGIDQAVNEGFLKRLAVLGGGSSEIVESEDRLDEVMARVHRRIGTPVLTGLHLEPSGLKIEPDSLVPGRLPDLFAGAPLLLMGRYRGKGAASIAIQARDGAGQTWTESARGIVQEHGALTSMWARGHIRELEDRYAIGQTDRAELAKRIVGISLAYGVLCRFTAFVAVDRSAVVNQGGLGHRITQPVEMPAGWGKGAMPRSARGGIGGYRAASAPDLACAGQADTVDSYLAAPELNRCESIPPAAPQAAAPPSASAWKATAKQAGPPKARKQGLMSKMLGSIFGGGDAKDGSPAVPAPAPMDLSAYRKRAAELLESLKGCQETDPLPWLRALGLVAEKLAALIEDLKSVGAGAAEIPPLEKLVAEVRSLLTKKRPEARKIASLWTRAEELLQAMAEGATSGPAPAASKRSEFWK
jgi:Ca-activated chloride channel family protein